MLRFIFVAIFFIRKKKRKNILCKEMIKQLRFISIRSYSKILYQEFKLTNFHLIYFEKKLIMEIFGVLAINCNTICNRFLHTY